MLSKNPFLAVAAFVAGFSALVVGSAASIPTGASTSLYQPAVLSVDRRHPDADDRGPGTPNRPLRTIGEAAGRALRNRRAGLATTVQIQPGVYREAIDMNGVAGDPAVPIVFEGAGTGEVVVSGADVWTGWEREPASDLFRRAWSVPARVAPVPAGWESVRAHLERHPILRRGDMVFVDGEPFEQVFDEAELRSRPRTFLVQDEPPAVPVLRVHSATDLAAADVLVEVAVRPVLLVVNRVNDLVVRGIVFRHAATLLQDAAVRIDASVAVVVDRCHFIRNSWNGLGIYRSRDVTVTQVAANHNGSGGIQGWRVRNLRVEDSEASHNNWRGARGDFRDWATGQKFLSIHGGAFVRYRAIGNAATGLWFDTDARDIVVEDAQICGNETRGVFLEASPGPFLLRNSRICDNREVGLMATGAARVTLESNTIAGNGGHQIAVPWLVDDHVEAQSVDYETGRTSRVRTERWTLSGNVITGSEEALLIGVGRWPWFLDTFRSSRNRWSHASRQDAFALYDRNGAEATRVDFNGWRAISAQEKDSSMRP